MSIYSIADNIISPLGITSEDNVNACRHGQSAITYIDEKYSPEPFYGAKISDEIRHALYINDDYTWLETLYIKSIEAVLDKLPSIDKHDTVLIFSTTKGNIDKLQGSNEYTDKRSYELLPMANRVNGYFGMSNAPIVVSNACISGLSAIITAKRLLDMGKYQHALVTGGDILSDFVVSGFQSLKAISNEPCRPYDQDRKGINLGEACGSMFLTKDKSLAESYDNRIRILAGSQSNDANHISGPSRTGSGLQLAIKRALSEANIGSDDIQYISAHGTATIFNDEMEAQAFKALQMDGIPLNSLKGYFGHTLGAAGIVETIMAIHQINKGMIISSQGYNTCGITHKLNVAENNLSTDISLALKTTSGFGGCNAAVVLQKT